MADGIALSIAEHVKKRFRSVLEADAPENWEVKAGLVDGTSGCVESAELPSTRDQDDEDNFCLGGRSIDDSEDGNLRQPQKRARRRGALRPNSITEKLVRNVADGHSHQINAAISGKELSEEEVLLCGLHDKFSVLQPSVVPEDIEVPTGEEITASSIGETLL